MKVLFVCHRFPFPPNRGGKIRPFNIIKHLHQSGHEVTVASLARSQQEKRDGAGLADHCHHFLVERVTAPMAMLRMIVRLPVPTPSSMGYFYSPRLARRIADLVGQTSFDLVFVHCSSVAQYVADVAGPTKILDFGDMDSQKWLAYASEKPFPLSFGYRLEGHKMRRAEERLATQFDLCTATTAAEKKTLDDYGVADRTGWFPNGVDSEYFSPDGTEYDPDLIGFLGRMDYFPNCDGMLHFCAETLPLIRDKRPGTKLIIVGSNPTPEIERLAELPDVTVTGFVKDVRPDLRRCALTVAPLRVARGTQNKILESLAASVPCVSSDIAAGGVDAVAGEHLLVASSPRETAEAVIRLLDDPEERQRFADAGRERMLSHHSWENSMKRLDGLIEACLPSASA